MKKFREVDAQGVWNALASGRQVYAVLLESGQGFAYGLYDLTEETAGNIHALLTGTKEIVFYERKEEERKNGTK